MYDPQFLKGVTLETVLGYEHRGDEVDGPYVRSKRDAYDWRSKGACVDGPVEARAF